MVIAISKLADIVLMVLDASKSEGHRQILTKELEAVGLRLNRRPLQIHFKKKKTGDSPTSKLRCHQLQHEAESGQIASKNVGSYGSGESLHSLKASNQTSQILWSFLLIEDVKYVLLWGTSARHFPSIVASQMLEDEDVVQIVKKNEKEDGGGRGWLKSHSNGPSLISDREKRAPLKT
ncbi:hypothetical protein EJD97_024873 [Solanum chilense]|uniref:Uncharacterized protein n=1 Tax=Solanum chilense TaxID=4083 RepID=A0A6N2C3A9_SOLCI|nr:hypothetical protein EJD97_024873 [Solanum chilense]